MKALFMYHSSRLIELLSFGSFRFVCCCSFSQDWLDHHNIPDKGIAQCMYNLHKVFIFIYRLLLLLMIM